MSQENQRPDSESRPPLAGSRARRRRRSRGSGEGGGRPRWLVPALAVVGTVAVVGVVGLLVLSRFLDPERVAAWVEPRLESAVNREVELGRVEVALLPLGVRVEQVQVADPTGLAPSLASLERMELRVKLLPLLSRNVQVARLELDGLVANLRKGPDGLTNYGDFSAAEEPAPPPTRAEGQGVEMALEGIRLTGASVSYESAEDSLALQVTELGGRASVRRTAQGAWAVDGDWNGRLSLAGSGAPAGGSSEPGGPGDAASVPTLSNVPMTLRLGLDLPEDASSLEIRDGALSLDRVELALSGSISDLQEPVRQVSLAVTARNVPLSEVVALATGDGPELDAQGTLSGSVTLNGPLSPDTLPVAEGTLEVASGAVALDGSPLLEDVDAAVTVEGSTLRPRIRGRLLDGELALDGVVRMADDAMDLRLAADPDLTLVPTSLLPEGLLLGGTLPMDVRLTGDPAAAASWRFWGTLAGRDLTLDHPALGVPLGAPAPALTLQGDGVEIPATELRAGNDAFRLQGRLYGLPALLDGSGTPEFQGSLSGRRASLLELVADPPPDTAVTYGQVAFAKVGARRIRGLDADEAARELGLSRPTSLPLAGQLEVALDTLVDRKGRMENVRAVVVFGPELLQVTEASFRRYGGSFRTVGALEVGADPEEPFNLQLQARGVDAGAFLEETTPLGRAVSGTLDLQVDLTGALDALLLPGRSTLQGSGSFTLVDGALTLGPLGGRLAEFLGLEALANPSVSRWASGFLLQDGRILLDESAVQGAPGNPTLGGGIGLDGGLALTSAFQFRRSRMSRSVLERVGLTEAAGEIITAVLEVGGTLADPDLRADPAGTAARATESVQEQAREEVDRRLQEQKEELQERATGFLRGLFRRGEEQAPPPDSLVADTLAADSTAADTLPSDTLLPDSIRPDTTRPDTTRPDTTATGPGGSG